MKGVEVKQLMRDEEILRLRLEENLTYRQIAAKVALSHVMVGKILRKHRVVGAELQESIDERREQIAEALERTIKRAYDKYHSTGAASDLHAFVKVLESYKMLLGLNSPTTHQHEVSYSHRVDNILDAVLVDAPSSISGGVSSGEDKGEAMSGKAAV